MNIRKLIISGLSFLVLAGGMAGCMPHQEYLLPEENIPIMQNINYQGKGFNYIEALKILRNHPEDYPEYLENCDKECRSEQ